MHKACLNAGALQGGEHAGIGFAADVVGGGAAGVCGDAVLGAGACHGGVEEDFRSGGAADVPQAHEKNPHGTDFFGSFRLTLALLSAIKIHVEQQISTEP